MEPNAHDDPQQLNKDLERMIDEVEDILVQLSWISYDLVVQRTSPDLVAAVQRLGEAYRGCRAAVCGEREDKEPEKNRGPEPSDPAATPPENL